MTLDQPFPSPLSDEALLQAAGLRVTRPRLAVLGFLRQQAQPVSHSDLVGALTPQGFDRATLYRNLMDLTQAAVILRDHYGDTVWRYQLPPPADHSHCDHNHEQPCQAALEIHRHPHFVCMTCNGVQCLPTLVALDLLLPDDPASIATVEEVVLRGLCSGCR